MEKKSIKKISKDYNVQKRNGLDIISNKKNEMRLFAVYLCRIDKKNPETRRVRFSLRDFERICGVDNQQSKAYYLRLAQEMLKKLMQMPVDGGIRVNQIFSECFIGFDGEGYGEENLSYFVFDAHDKALDMLFEYQNKFFSYKLYNILGMSGENPIRFYEMLKEIFGYEAGVRKKREPKKSSKDPVIKVVTITEIKERLQIDKDSYTLFYEFKRRVLDPCREEICEKTDIEFDYEPVKVGRRAGKIKFTIREKPDFADPLEGLFDNEEIPCNSIEIPISHAKMNLDINQDNAEETVAQVHVERSERIKAELMEICSDKFTLEQLLSLYEELKLYASHYANDDSKLLQGVKIAVTRALAYRVRSLFSYARKVIQSLGKESEPMVKERKKSLLYTHDHERLEQLYNQIQFAPNDEKLKQEYNNIYQKIFGHR